MDILTNNTATFKYMDEFDLKNGRILAGFLILILCFISFAASMFFANKNKNHLFLSLRSSNILYVTNISIFFSEIILCIQQMFYYLDTQDDKNKSKKHENLTRWVYSLYFLFHLLTYISTFLKYHHLVMSTKINFLEDDLINYKIFSTRSYHFEYFYIRLLAIISFILICIYIPFAAIKKDLYKKVIPLPICSLDLSKDSYGYIIWIVVFFLENSILFTYGFFVYQKELKAKLKLELFILIILNLVYSLGLGIYILASDGGEYSYYITIIYLFFFQFLSVYYPCILCKIDNVTTSYSLTKDTAEDLYLFLSDENCYDRFEKYLFQDIENLEENANLLDLYTYIIKFRISVLLGGSGMRLAKEIYNKYIDKNRISSTLNFHETEDIKMMKRTIHLSIQKNDIRIEMFDLLLEKIYSALNDKFIEYKKTDDFKDLIYEINYDTYIRCKLANCGLIKK